MCLFLFAIPSGFGLEGFVSFDDFYRGALSKCKYKKQQRQWAVIDAVSVRYMLLYIFTLVRTQGGSTGAKYTALSILKSYVQTPAVQRRQSKDALETVL